MTAIAQLLQGSLLSPQKLYALLNESGDSNRNKNGGLGTLFQEKPRHILVTEALTIDDQAKTVTVKSVVTLYELAHFFLAGKHNKQHRANSNKYALCLALICYDEMNHYTDKKKTPHDLRHTQKVLEELSKLYDKEIGFLKDQSALAGSSIKTLIKKKQQALQEILKSTVVPTAKITAVSLKFLNATHAAQHVLITDEKKEEKAYILKCNVDSRVAGLEVFSGTLMELYIGSHQPSTYQKITGIRNTVDILSEQINFQALNNPTTFRTWANKGFPDAAPVDVANLFLGENDYHHKNGGIRQDNQRLIRIDFDQSLCDLTWPMLDTDCKTHKRQWIAGLTYEIPGNLKAHQCFAIHEDDLTSLPILPTVLTHSKLPNDQWADHYVPYHWWTHCINRNKAITDKIAQLSVNPHYLAEKFRSMLEKIIMPQQIIEGIAKVTIFNLQDQQQVQKRMEERRKTMQEKALKVPGFIEYVRNKGHEGLLQLQGRFKQFCEKRKDLFTASTVESFAKRYEDNFKVYLENLPKPVAEEKVNQENKLDFAVKSPSSPTPHEQINKLLLKMSQEGLSERDLAVKKSLQKTFFQREIIEKLSLNALKQLSDLMHDVQLGKSSCEAFDTIRTERKNCLGSGNTQTWCSMRTAVKQAIFNLLTDSEVKTNYQDYARLFSQHSSRCYARWGKTHSFKQFEEKFSATIKTR